MDSAESTTGGATEGCAVRVWRLALFAGVLIVSIVGIAAGRVGSGVFWGLLAAVALIGEFVRWRTGGTGSFRVVTVQAAIISIALVAASAALIIAAAMAPSDDERNKYIGTAVLVVPVAILVCWVTVAGYQRVRRMSTESQPHQSQSEVFTDLVNESRAQTQTSDPQRPQRQRRLRLFFAIGVAGWLIGTLAQSLTSQWGPVSTAIAVIVGALLMVGAALAAGWTSVWVFKDKSSAEKSDDRDE